MGTYSSYYLYQKFQIIGNQDPIPVIPLTYSVSGDSLDPQPLVEKLENDPKCGYVPPVEYQYRDIESGYTCVDYDKYTKIVRQRSSDGINWENVSYSAGTLIEHNSTDCGYVGELYRWVNSGTTCYEGDKYIRIIQQVSYDGINWTNTGQEARGTMIEAASPDCIEYRWVDMDVSTDWICDECPDFSELYLTFIPISGSSTFGWNSASGTASGNTVQYSLDSGETWSNLSSGQTVTVNQGNKIYWKASGLTPTNFSGIGTFSSTGNFTVEGNAMSLYYGDNFVNQTSLSGKHYALYGLFSGNTNVTSAENLSLPATTLAYYCYADMFYGCTSLTTAPELPATTLSVGSYLSMFWGCTSLTTAPELPATTLANLCYGHMFLGCTSLTTAPSLPATTLGTYCYGQMFYNCTSLTTAPSVLPATTLAERCYQDMFAYCTNLTTAPSLPATTLTSECYNAMFSNCTSLNSVTCLATDISARYCTTNWVYNVSSTGTFTKASSMTSWTRGADGIPYNWTVQNYS